MWNISIKWRCRKRKQGNVWVTFFFLRNHLFAGIFFTERCWSWWTLSRWIWKVSNNLSFKHLGLNLCSINPWQIQLIWTKSGQVHGWSILRDGLVALQALHLSRWMELGLLVFQCSLQLGKLTQNWKWEEKQPPKFVDWLVGTCWNCIVLRDRF